MLRDPSGNRWENESMPALTTERLLLRPWKDEDLPAFAAMNKDPDVMAFMPKRLTREESDATAERICHQIETAGWGLWALEVTGIAPFAGFVGLSVPRFEAHFTPCVEVGWRLAKAYWGKGYATEAGRAAIAYGFDTLGLSQIVSFTTPGNWRSRAVMQRLGMRHDPHDDFDHPVLETGHPLRRHVLFRLTKASWAG
jgi:RimJ/RimL family protein N-acetyltransferase